jgi:nucleoside phosphorylase
LRDWNTHTGFILVLGYNRATIERGKLIIFAAMQLEAKAIAKAFGAPYAHRREAIHFMAGEWAGELHTVGIRARHVPAGVIRERAGYVIMAGLAGGLDRSLRCGDIVVDGSVELATCGLPFRFGGIHTSGELVARPEQKAALFRQTGALAVEMENAVVRQAAAAAGVPFVGVRAVCDTADEAVDPAVLDFIDDVGQVRLGALAAGLLRRPRLVAEIWRLADRSKRAATCLGEAVRAIADRLRDRAVGR